MNNRLQLKLAENRERRERQQVLASLPEAWVALVANEETINSWEFLDEFPVSFNFELTKQPLLSNKKVNYIDCDDLDVAQSYLKKQQMVLSPPVLCWFGFGPAFIVKHAIPVGWVSDLVCLNYFRVSLAEADFSRGVSCSEYLGILRDGRSTNGNEDVYEIMSFE